MYVYIHTYTHMYIHIHAGGLKRVPRGNWKLFRIEDPQIVCKAQNLADSLQLENPLPFTYPVPVSLCTCRFVCSVRRRVFILKTAHRSTCAYVVCVCQVCVCVQVVAPSDAGNHGDDWT